MTITSWLQSQNGHWFVWLWVIVKIVCDSAFEFSHVFSFNKKKVYKNVWPYLKVWKTILENELRKKKRKKIVKVMCTLLEWQKYWECNLFIHISTIKNSNFKAYGISYSQFIYMHSGFPNTLCKDWYLKVRYFFFLREF